MKTIRKDLREGVIKLKVETPSDLWHLEKIVEPGDQARAATTRKIIINRGGDLKTGERKKMILTVEAEKMELTESAFRITGPIKAGPEDIQLNSYHTLQIEIGDEIEIKKVWKKHHLDRIKKAQETQPLVLICILDREDADIAMLKESGIEKLGRIKSGDPEAREEYYAEITAFLEKEEGYSALILAGPGFERENLQKYMKEKKSPLAGKAHLVQASSTGLSGINEVLKSSATAIINKTRIAEESQYVEKLMEEIKKEGLAVYGPKETEEAVNAGAVQTLLVSESKMKDYEILMSTIEKLQGKVMIIGTDHSMGEQFLHMGGIGGFLRYKLKYYSG
ncbi:MAG: mRNA surveillance protein pelota [Candidatus Aenigmarchaeota archaeon]|nr:mRNA surveillance protein pelota [Candidatus Aenigmarchaeota archaeon]